MGICLSHDARPDNDELGAVDSVLDVAAFAGIAEGAHAGAIVVGARDRRPIAEAIVGGVSRAIVQAFRIPVIVVHLPREDLDA